MLCRKEKYCNLWMSGIYWSRFDAWTFKSWWCVHELRWCYYDDRRKWNIQVSKTYQQVVKKVLTRRVILIVPLAPHSTAARWAARAETMVSRGRRKSDGTVAPGDSAAASRRANYNKHVPRRAFRDLTPPATLAHNPTWISRLFS